MEMRDKLSFNDFKEVIRIMKSKYFASTNKETSNLELLEQKKMKSINKYNPIFNEKNISKNQTAKFNQNKDSILSENIITLIFE